VAAHHRLGLEKLCRYGMRPSFCQERLRLTAAGQVELSLRRPWPMAEGTSVLRFAPLDFLRRLTPLIPPPYAHLIRYFGLLAPHAKGRDRLPPAPVSWAGIRPTAFLRGRTAPGRGQHVMAGDTAPDYPPSAATPPAAAPSPVVPYRVGPADALSTGNRRPPRQRLSWAELLRRVFAVDVLVCQKCLGPMTVIATLTDPTVLEKILEHLGLPTAPLPLAPAQRYGQLELLENLDEQGDVPHGESGVHGWSRPAVGPGSSRSPPADGDGEWMADPEVPTVTDDGCA
jgi:hypothetical protein